MVHILPAAPPGTTGQVSPIRAADPIDFGGAALVSVATPRLLFIERCQFTEADLRQAPLDGCCFKLCNFERTNLRGASLRGASFAGCDLSGADFRGADLYDTSFSAIGAGAGARPTTLDGARFDPGALSVSVRRGDRGTGLRSHSSWHERVSAGSSGAVTSVVARLVSLDDEHFPGWARVRVSLADGTTAQIEEKQPVLGLDDQDPGELVFVPCEVLRREEGSSVAVRLLHGIVTTDGRDIMTVMLEDVRAEP